MKALNVAAPVVFVAGLIFYVQGDGWVSDAGLFAIALAIGWMSVPAVLR